MGGSALLIHGSPSPDLLTPRPAPRSLVDRLLGRHPVSGPTETPLGRGRVLLEIPSGPLRSLSDDFRRYVDHAFDDPWPSTMCVRDYLAMDVMTVYLRGERGDHGAPDWYVQLTFSACAGMADTSAEVAAHWAEIWYRQAGSELASKYFLPFGFTPGRVETLGPAKRFVPLGGLGYALFRTAADADATDPDSHHFELDWAGLESLSEEDVNRHQAELDAALGDVRAAGVCLCQFCAPGQDLSRFDRLSIVSRPGGHHSVG
jgi:hypothetical protein